MNDATTISPYLRMAPIRTQEEVENERLCDIAGMIRTLRAKASARLGARVTVSVRLGSYGWELTIYNPHGRDRDFSGDRLVDVFRDAMAWASRDEVTEGYLTLGLDATGARIAEGV